MMDITNQEISAGAPANFMLQVSGKWIAYGILLVLALLLRIADIGSVPMSAAEAERALSAYHLVSPDAPGQPQSAQSSLMFWMQAAAFSGLGGSEGVARIAGVLGGLALMLTPLLYEQQIGSVRAFILSLLLAVSPVAFAAARTTDPLIWVAVLGLLLIRAAQHYWQNRNEPSAYLLTLAFVALVLLAGPGGTLLGIILLISAAATFGWMIWVAPFERDTPGDDLIAEFNTALGAFPAQRAALLGGASILILSTGFMLYPAGFSVLAELRGAISGFWSSAPDGVVSLLGMRALLVYEPLLLLAGITGAVALLRSTPSFLDRLMAVWFVVGFAVLLVYRASTTAHALLLVLPLSWMASGIIERIVTGYTGDFGSGMSFFSRRRVQSGMIWLAGVVVLALFVMLFVHLQEVGRGLQNFPYGSSLSVLLEAQFATFRASLTWVVITLMLFVVAYLLVSSYRGTRDALYGFSVGFALLLILSGIGTGWNAAVVHAANPLDLWRGSVPAPDTYLLRQTLLEVARRDTRGFPEIPVTVVIDPAAGLTEDGLVAWLLRDFPNARFVPALSDAQRDEIVLMAETPEDPDLGGSYVGQRFTIQQQWSVDSLRPADWVAWLFQRRVASDTTIANPAILWLRIDVYDGVPGDERPRG